MQRTIMAALAVLAAGAALAGDLPSKNAPVPPTFQRATEVVPTGYIGLNSGATVGTGRAYTGGVVAGYNYSQYLAAEYGYEYIRPAHGGDTRQQVALSILPKYRLGNSPLSVYALGGVGYSWDEKSKNGTTYSYGGGVKYDVSKSVELDARIKRVEFFSNGPGVPRTDDRFTIGLNFKF